MISLYESQKDAVEKMHNGCILCGGVGSGKSRTALAYYCKSQSGTLDPFHLAKSHPKDLYIITTARKRDTLEWEGELAVLYMSTDPKQHTLYNNKVVVDSWNNIKKYESVKDAFFIFDEQRVVGYGAWSKTFIKIAKQNQWILLSATPGDKWEDYIPVFLANGFYKNITEFRREHLVYDQYTKFPKVTRYLGTKRLERLRNRILVDIEMERQTVQHHEDIFCTYDRFKYKDTIKTRTNPYSQGYIPCRESDYEALLIGTDISSKAVDPVMPGWEFDPVDGEYVKLVSEPIQNAAGLCYTLRRIVNEDVSRQLVLLELFEKHPKMIIFYNFDYELDILRGLYYGEDVEIAEWNGHKHQPVPTTKSWVYLVQYTAGAEGWNCITTDTIVFFSQNYSYKIMEQSAGRIDRLNTLFTDLYYYHLKSRAGIDLAISRAIAQKKKFNERKFVTSHGYSLNTKVS